VGDGGGGGGSVGARLVGIAFYRATTTSLSVHQSAPCTAPQHAPPTPPGPPARTTGPTWSSMPECRFIPKNPATAVIMASDAVKAVRIMSIPISCRSVGRSVRRSVEEGEWCEGTEGVQGRELASGL